MGMAEDGLDDLKGRTYPTYSFYDLFYAEEQILAGQKPNVDPALFRDRLVFIGTTALSTFKLLAWVLGRGSLVLPGLNRSQFVAVYALPITPAEEGEQRVRQM